MDRPLIYHICRRDEWAAAEAAGSYGGSLQDRADGFIHFSAADQVEASAARHRAGQDGLVLRSEEHTSELQSLMRISYAVFCLKKKKKNDKYKSRISLYQHLKPTNNTTH